MLVDMTNENIPLSLHAPMLNDASGEVAYSARIYVDTDADSSFDPPQWVDIMVVDDEHDSDRVKLTFEEAGLLHDRLGLILGRPGQASLGVFATC